MPPEAISDKGSTPPRPVRKDKNTWLKRARQWHLYLGTFFACSILFFAFSGSLQLFALHRSQPGSNYKAPVWIQELDAVHQNQNLNLRLPPDQQALVIQRQRQQLQDHPERRGIGWWPNDSVYTFILKLFFFGTGIGLVLTSILGIYMSFKYSQNRIVVWSLLILGAVIPLAMLVLMPHS